MATTGIAFGEVWFWDTRNWQIVNPPLTLRDTETWMYPPLLGLYPDIGRSLLTYRVERIPEAKLKALEGQS